MKTYVSSYCNFPHRVSDGRPIEHECRIIPPLALWAERDGDYEAARLLIAASPVRIRHGVRADNVED